eukprot:6295666-Pyramimonas_sp.AAC.1
MELSFPKSKGWGSCYYSDSAEKEQEYSSYFSYPEAEVLGPHLPRMGFCSSPYPKDTVIVIADRAERRNTSHLFSLALSCSVLLCYAT